MNHFAGDDADDLRTVQSHCRELGVAAVHADVYARGGDGAVDLAEAVVEAAQTPSEPHPLYDSNLGLAAKVECVAKQIYGAAAVHFEGASRKKLQQYESLGFGHLPVCVAKTQSSLSDNPKLMGAPSGFTVTITDAHLSAGAGFVVVIAGNMLRMPGLGKDPQALRMNVTADGEIVGLQ
jgi:formate--tetrahydrofolate ligase